MKDSIRVIQPGKRRVKIFVDFWNVVINARKQTSSALPIDVNWQKLASGLVQETSGGYGDETTSLLAGCYIFGSFSSSDPHQREMIERVQDNFGANPGIYFDFIPRVKKQTNILCDTCKKPISHSTESGVDALICIEMIKHAAMREHEYLALVSSDRDFLPLLSFLKDRGERVIHASTSGKQREMRSMSWKQVDLVDDYVHLCTISDERCIILTAPIYAERNKVIEALLSEISLPFVMYDITDPNSICDRDLKFILSNQRPMLKVKGGQPNHLYAGDAFFGSISAFRAAVRDSKILDGLPHISRNGEPKAYADKQWGWMLAGTSSDQHIWKRLREAEVSS